MAIDQIDDSLLNELRIGSVPTGTQTLDPSMSAGQMGVPTPQPPQRPTFMSAFLANLGPALAGGMARASGKGGFAGGIAQGVGGAAEGIEAQKRYGQQLSLQQQQIGSEASLRDAQRQQALAQANETNINAQLMKAHLDIMNNPGAFESSIDNAVSPLGKLSPEEQAGLNTSKQEARFKGDMSPVAEWARTTQSQRAIFGRQQTMLGERAQQARHLVRTPDGNGMQALDANGNLLSVIPTQQLPAFAQEISTTGRLIQTDQGYEVVPITSTKQKQPSSSAAPTTGGTAGAAQPVSAPGGGQAQPLPAGQTRSRADAATAQNDVIDRIQDVLKNDSVTINGQTYKGLKSHLGVLPGRVSDAEKMIGNAPPDVQWLYGSLKSAYSLAGSTHGWRALQVADEFEKAFGGLKTNPDSLSAGLEALRETGQSVQKAAGRKPTGSSTSTKPKVDIDALLDKVLGNQNAPTK